MLSNLIQPLALTAALGSGLMAGLYFSFSICVMRALARLSPAQGIAAMQAINASILNAAFALVFVGTGLTGLTLAVAMVLDVGWSGAGNGLLGCVAYLAGSLVLTLAYHVPQNEALARLDPGSADAAERWARYRSGWTMGNHVRCATSLLAMAAFALAMG